MYLHRHRQSVRSFDFQSESISTYFIQKYVRPITLSQTCSSPSRTAADRFELQTNERICNNSDLGTIWANENNFNITAITA